jgi:adenylate kinase
MRIVLLGAPGSGKGTQGPRIARRYGVRYVSTGALLREHIRAGTGLGRAAAPIVERGELVSGDLVLPLVLEVVRSPESSDGYVLDGFPRTTPEAVAADEATASTGGFTDAVVFLDVSPDDLIQRLGQRARRSGRADDQGRSVIERRMREYETKTAPLRRYYEDRGLLVPVDGSGPVDDVTQRVFAALEAHTAGTSNTPEGRGPRD